MSKLAKKPLVIPQGVEAKINGPVLEFSGKEGKLSVPILPYVSAEITDGKLSFKTNQDVRQGRLNIGTNVSLAKNAVQGVSAGFVKVLELEGIGFKAVMDGANLVLTVGFTHPVKYNAPAGIKISIEKNAIKISGIDKALVGEAAAKIRKIRPPEPYKGKGIHYRGEVIRRKAGKKVAGTGAAAA
ncbi:MAG: 50S ribosomal protein L6 [Parcubacteria group bacterium GW2011_GWA2_47_8b]|nr:MAG: 50S ribosomal protein L6 [Parcubacteria group bacterium GW2011_GWA2_47_8b]